MKQRLQRDLKVLDALRGWKKFCVEVIANDESCNEGPVDKEGGNVKITSQSQTVDPSQRSWVGFRSAFAFGLVNLNRRNVTQLRAMQQ